MREIKFRAMMRGEHPGHEGRWAYIWGIGHDQWNSRSGRYYGNIQEETKGQFTGLKDKNGKEIYEGDILKSSENVFGEVVWRHYQWNIGRMLGVKRNSLGEPDFNWPEWSVPSIGWVENLGVVGNIYENPELVTKAAGA